MIAKAFSACFAFALLLALAGCGGQPVQPRPERGDRYCPPPPPACPAPVAAEIPVWQPVAGKTVILDPGHGGKDEGTAHFGLREKDVNLDLATRTAGLLRAKGVIVHMTRTGDGFVSLADRSAFANRHPDAVLVSIHVNASERNPNAFGVETFVLSSPLGDAERGKIAANRFRMNGDASESGRQALANLAIRSRSRGPALAASLQRSLVARLGEPDRGVKSRDLAVLRETYFCPAVLVEVGFLSHAPTASRMRTEDWRRRAADALSEGIADFLRQPQ